VLGRQPVVDGYHDRVGADGMLATGTVVGVEVAHHEAAAVEVHRNRRCPRATGICWGPIDPDADGAGRPVNGPVLDAEFGVHRPARQVAQPLPHCIDSILS
jgi:hypothetical protein